MGFTELQQSAAQGSDQGHKGGVVIIDTPKDHGLTNLFYSICLRSHDAFLEHAQTIEHDQEEDLEGITQNKLKPSASRRRARNYTMVDWVISQEPDVLGVGRVEQTLKPRHN